MTNDVRGSYDRMAAQYAALFLGDLETDMNGRACLARFAGLAALRSGPVADLGCGPGHVVDHLSGLGLTVVGYDLSPGQINEARSAFADLEFHVGNLAALDRPDSSLGGIVARYSLIHMDPSELGDVFVEWERLLEPGAPVLVSFFASPSVEDHGDPFDHAVVTAHLLFPATIAQHLCDAGFTDLEIDICHPPAGARPLDHATIIARTSSA